MLKPSTRLLAALPDALTAVTYFCAWVAPALLGVVWVRNLQTTILIELLVLHASALYGFGVAKNRQWKRWMLLSALSVVYLLVMLALARKLQSPWPIFAFFWLFTCRFGYILLHPATAERDSERAQWVWLWSVVAFAIGSWLGDHLSLPKLGMTEHYARRLRLPGDAENGVAPHLTMAFGTTYFLLQAYLKVHFERSAQVARL
jgi:hypothetical protein